MSKLFIYNRMNEDLSVHTKVYGQTDPIILECHRIACYRLHVRLVSHNLSIETGRWVRFPENNVCFGVEVLEGHRLRFIQNHP